MTSVNSPLGWANLAKFPIGYLGTSAWKISSDCQSRLRDQARVIAMARCGFDMAIKAFSGLKLQELFDFHMRLSARLAGEL